MILLPVGVAVTLIAFSRPAYTRRACSRSARWRWRGRPDLGGRRRRPQRRRRRTRLAAPRPVHGVGRPAPDRVLEPQRQALLSDRRSAGDLPAAEHPAGARPGDGRAPARRLHGSGGERPPALRHRPSGHRRVRQAAGHGRHLARVAARALRGAAAAPPDGRRRRRLRRRRWRRTRSTTSTRAAANRARCR